MNRVACNVFRKRDEVFYAVGYNWNCFRIILQFYFDEISIEVIGTYFNYKKTRGTNFVIDALNCKCY